MAQLFQIEVAGSAITLTDEEAALVVYTDDSLRGELVFVQTTSDLEFYSATAHVIERSVGDRTVCAAIFPRLPILSHLKPSYKDRGQMSGTYQVRLVSKQWLEEITLFVSNVAELDWRGRK
jgi:hypothetical protein